MTLDELKQKRKEQQDTIINTCDYWPDSMKLEAYLYFYHLGFRVPQNPEHEVLKLLKKETSNEGD